MNIDYDSYAKQFDRDDYWRQIKRTVNGVPVSDEDISLIVEQISLGLDLNKSDFLLDLACGNGALSRFLFSYIFKLHGVDKSAYLIDIAKSDFEEKNKFTFECKDVLEYLINETEPDKFTKVLCYGSFSYFSSGEEVLSLLNKKFLNVERFFIGNLPDLDKVSLFYKDEIPGLNVLKSHDSSIGMWRGINEFDSLAKSYGWKAKFMRMPESYYSSHYRYDVLLERR